MNIGRQLNPLLLLALLAWLAKRWENLDVLYKCLLASLIAHVLLMLWFQEVYPERELYAAGEPGGGTRMRIRMDADPTGRNAARAERGGAIEVARAAPSPDPSAVRVDGATTRSVSAKSAKRSGGRVDALRPGRRALEPWRDADRRRGRGMLHSCRRGAPERRGDPESLAWARGVRENPRHPSEPRGQGKSP